MAPLGFLIDLNLSASKRNISWRQRRPVRGAENPAIFVFSKNSGSLDLLELYGPALVCIGIDVYLVKGSFDPRVLIIVGERILGCHIYLAESNQAENTG
jgi:hypothetical protein